MTALLVLALLLQGAPAESPRSPATTQVPAVVVSAEPPRPLLAAQVFVLPKGATTPEGLAKEMDALRRAGVGLVIVRAFHMAGDRKHGAPDSRDAAPGAYFKTGGLPLVEDLIPSAAIAAHAAGLRCYAWMATRKTPYAGIEEAQRDVAWNFRTQRFGPSPGLDLFDETVVARLERTWADLARTGVDGVLMQDDLMLAHLEGWSDDARAYYTVRSGREPDPRQFYIVEGEAERAQVRYAPQFWDFARMRNARLLDVAERLQASARTVNGEFETALNLYYETALNPPMGLAWFAQDLDAAAARDFRWLALMAYHRQIADELSLDDAGLARTLATIAKRLDADEKLRPRLLVKLQSVDWRSGAGLDVSEIAGAAWPFRRAALCLAPLNDAASASRLLPALLDPKAPPPPAEKAEPMNELPEALRAPPGFFDKPPGAPH